MHPIVNICCQRAQMRTRVNANINMLLWVHSSLVIAECSATTSPRQALSLFCTLHRLTNGSHVELPCNEVPQPEAGDIAQYLSTAARAWWQSVVAESHSFTKTPSYLGLPGQQVTNMLTTGAKERTAGTIRVVQNGVTGFSRAGDRICMNVKVGMHYIRFEVYCDRCHWISISNSSLYLQ